MAQKSSKKTDVQGGEDFSTKAALKFKKSRGVFDNIRSFLETTQVDKTTSCVSLFDGYDIENLMGRQDFYKHKACLEDLIGLQRRQFLMKMLTLSPANCMS